MEALADRKSKTEKKCAAHDAARARRSICAPCWRDVVSVVMSCFCFPLVSEALRRQNQQNFSRKLPTLWSRQTSQTKVLRRKKEVHDDEEDEDDLTVLMTGLRKRRRRKRKLRYKNMEEPSVNQSGDSSPDIHSWTWEAPEPAQNRVNWMRTGSEPDQNRISWVRTGLELGQNGVMDQNWTGSSWENGSDLNLKSVKSHSRSKVRFPSVRRTFKIHLVFISRIWQEFYRLRWIRLAAELAGP